jgi:hypothetical protein
MGDPGPPRRTTTGSVDVSGGPARKIRCAARSEAVDSMYESARWSGCSLRRFLCICALGACSGGFLFWQRLLCAVVRRLLRLSWLRVLRLLPELLWLWLGRLLSALVAASVLRRVLWRVAKALVGRRTRLAWRPMARPSLTWPQKWSRWSIVAAPPVRL